MVRFSFQEPENTLSAFNRQDKYLLDYHRYEKPLE